MKYFLKLYFKYFCEIHLEISLKYKILFQKSISSDTFAKYNYIQIINGLQYGADIGIRKTRGKCPTSQRPMLLSCYDNVVMRNNLIRNITLLWLRT